MPLRPGKNYPGSTIQINGSFSIDCDPFDPDVSVKFKLMSPSGKETTYVFGEDTEIQHDETGEFLCDVTPNEPGRWFYQWVVEDVQALKGVDQGDFLVQSTPFYQGIPSRY